jgi:biotin carboxyl carrier protein
MTEPEVRRVRDGIYSVVRNGRSYEVALDVTLEAEGGATGEAAVDGRRVPIHMEDKRRRTLPAGAGTVGGAAHGPVTLLAPMPGRVVAIPVSIGQAVQTGETVLVLEAMKMESALAAPGAGTVSEVLAQPGQVVQQRQPLLRIDPTTAA